MVHLVLAEESSTVQKVVELCFDTENIQVHCFSDGKSTLEYLKTQPVDVLLAEVSGPDMDGYELCRHIKQDPATVPVPVILLVGPWEDYDADRAKQVGCDRCLSKPLRTLELVNTVKELLSMPVASRDRLQSDLQPPGTRVEAPVAVGIPDVFSLTSSQCQATPFSYTRDISGMVERIGNEGGKSSAGDLLGKETMDLLANRLVELVRMELPRLLREESSD
jgi:CheY-like chemotaxis protein